MASEADEVLITYFLLCDQVIVDAQTGKHSIIGIYSVLILDRLPVHLNLAVAFGARVQSAEQRDFSLHLTGPDGSQVLATPPIRHDWTPVRASLQRFGAATVQLCLHLQRIPISQPGSYTAAIYCGADLLGTYPLYVALLTPPPIPHIGLSRLAEVNGPDAIEGFYAGRA